MAHTDRLEWTFIRAVAGHTVQTVGGAIFATATALWALVGWMYPSLRLPGFQLWMLAAICVGCYFVGAFLAWKDERTNKGAAESHLASVQASQPQPTMVIRRRRDDAKRQDDFVVDVTNEGHQADFWATIRTTGGGCELEGLAVWDGSGKTHEKIPKGATSTLRGVFCERTTSAKDAPPRFRWVVEGEDEQGRGLVAYTEYWRAETAREERPTFRLDLVLKSDPDAARGVLKRQFTFVGDEMSDETGRVL